MLLVVTLGAHFKLSLFHFLVRPLRRVRTPFIFTLNLPHSEKLFRLHSTFFCSLFKERPSKSPPIQCNIDFTVAASNDDTIRISSITITQNQHQIVSCELNFSRLMAGHTWRTFTTDTDLLFFSVVFRLSFIKIYWHRWIFNGELCIELLLNDCCISIHLLLVDSNNGGKRVSERKKQKVTAAQLLSFDVIMQHLLISFLFFAFVLQFISPFLQWWNEKDSLSQLHWIFFSCCHMGSRTS